MAVCKEDRALEIGFHQTISQPYIVAFITQQLDPHPTDRILEIGTGCGYQAGILSQLAAEVYSIEIIESLGRSAAETLERLGYKNVFVRLADGYHGWPEQAPFDGIIVSCSPDHTPPDLVAQLREGGRMIIPIGPFGDQELYSLVKRRERMEKQSVLPVRFVPMTGEAEQNPGQTATNLK